ncbi:hypothetical protein Peur_068147 [Populus x canadensis]
MKFYILYVKNMDAMVIMTAFQQPLVRRPRQSLIVFLQVWRWTPEINPKNNPYFYGRHTQSHNSSPSGY